jgi:autotransporter-associated beta strand protein
MKRATIWGGAVAAAMIVAVGAQAQTTNAWTVTGAATGAWSVVSNWSLGAYPDATDALAVFAGDYTANFQVTNDVDATINRLYFNDSTPGSQLRFVSQAGRVLTFGGTDARIVNSNTAAYAGQVHFYGPVKLDADRLYIDSGAPTLFYNVSGTGEMVVVRSNAQWFNANPNYSGNIVISNAAMVDYSGNGATNTLGSVDGATYVRQTGRIQFRDLYNTEVFEPVVIQGMSPNGSMRFYASSNVVYRGTTTLATNGVIGWSAWFDPAGVPGNSGGIRRDNSFNGTLTDLGGSRNVHFIHDISGTGPAATGRYSRLSQLLFGGTGSYGGYTHLSNSKEPDPIDAFGAFDGYLTLTNGANRLPTGTTMYLGGRMTDGINVGAVGASGILILAGADQEFAGLYTQGTGALNRVAGGVATNTTLTLNIASGATNLYRGGLGGGVAVPIDIAVANLGYSNNLALVKKGAGLLTLTANNTYTGPTTVEAGTLSINGDQRNGGLITILSGGTLGGTGQVGAIAAGGTVAPGNSAGTLTSHGDVTLGVGATLALELDDVLLGYESDKLVMNGGALSLAGGPDLSLTLLYAPTLGDAFTIVSGMSGFDPDIDGIFSGKPDLGTFDVSGSTFQIDYTPTEITVTVVPEPHTLGLLGLAALGGLLRRRMRG